ncbi:MAG TPA: galactokinase [Methylomirabilota bacterium]|nr:galactokinase [Methylomirabilota bacterium]
MSTDLFEGAALRAALRDVVVAEGGEFDDEAVRVVRAPGRVNLIGEHTDYNLGLVLPVAIDREIRIALVPTMDRRADLTRLDTGERAVIDLDAARERDGSWGDYVAGTAWSLTQAGIELTGVRGVVGSTLPENAGLSSSAAIELATAWALAGRNIRDRDPLDIARICQRAENEYVGVMSGLMDQFASACGVAGRALLLDCRSQEWEPVALPPDLRLVVLHSGSPRKLDGSAYNERRTQCEAAVGALAEVDPTIESLRDVSADLLARERSRLDPVVARRAEHVIAENDRVRATVAAFAANDEPAIGELFAASHRSLGELYEVTSPPLDALVEIARSVEGVIAARMTGAGFGGCTINLVHPGAVGALSEAIEARYEVATGLRARVMPVAAAAGAGELLEP